MLGCVVCFKVGCVNLFQSAPRAWYMCSLFSKCNSRVVVVRSCDRCLAGEAGDPAGKIHGARTRP